MLRLLALATVIAAACRLDKLLQSAGPPPPPSAFGAAALAFTAQPESARAGQRIAPVQVTVRDSSNAPVTKFAGLVTVTLDHSPGGAALNGRRTVPAVNGVATFSDLHIDKSGNGYALAATVEGLPAATSAMFEAKPGPATQLGFAAQPSDVMTDSVIRPPVVVAAFDAFGNPGADFTAAVRIALDRDASLLRSAKLGGTTTQAAQGGLARFSDLTIDQVGNGYTLRATADKLSDATSTAFNVSLAPPPPPPPPPPPAPHLVFTAQPQTTPAGQTLPPVQVTALDASNRVVSSFTGAVTVALGLNPGNGNLIGPTTTNAVAGVATFHGLSIEAAGNGYTLRATASGVTDATSDPFSITPVTPPGGAVRLAFSDQPIPTQAGQVIPTVRVIAVDASNRPLTSWTGTVVISLGSNPGNGTLAGAKSYYVSSSDGGIAQWANLSIDTPGDGYTLRATTAGLGDAISDPFDVTAGPPPPLAGATGLGFLGPQPGATRAGAVLSPPLQVEVLGYGGVRVTGFTGGIWVIIGSNPGGGTLSGTRRLVAVNGVATFSDLRIDIPGRGYTLRVTGGGNMSAAITNPFDITP